MVRQCALVTADLTLLPWSRVAGSEVGRVDEALPADGSEARGTELDISPVGSEVRSDETRGFELDITSVSSA